MNLILPLPCLASAVTGLTMRQVFGWRLTWSRMDFTPREPIRLHDFFLVMTTLACLFGMFRIPIIAWNIPQNIVMLGSLYASTIFTLCNLVVAIPCTYFAFRAKRPLTGFLGSFGASLIAPGFLGLTIGLSSLYSGSGSFASYFGLALLTGAAEGLIVSLGLLSLRRSGIRLLHYPPRSSPARMLGPESSVIEAAIYTQRNSHLIWTLGVALIAIVSSLSTSYLVYWRDNSENRIGRLQQELSATKGSISVRDWRVVGLKLGPNASQETLDSFPYLSQIDTLSVAQSKLSNAVIDSIEKLGKLQSLDLSYTDLDDNGLKRLTESSRWSKLQHLSVAGTNITPKSWQWLLSGTFSGTRTLQSIDLSDLGLTDENLKSPLFQFQSMKLAGNQISDSGLRLLLNQSGGFNRRLLDLSNNPIDGSGFTMACTFNRLVLDGNKLTDVTFGPQLKNLTVYGSLVLRNTQLTDGFLATLAATPTIHGVELGDGNFTEDGLKKNPTLSPRKLGLTGKQFTGVCFKDWKPFVNILSMSGSSLNDETIGYLAALPSVYDLDLSKTAITDAGLALVHANLSKLNLSDTKITAKGLLASSIPSFCEIRLATGQFTNAEIKRLRAKWKVIVGDVNPALGDVDFRSIQM